MPNGRKRLYGTLLAVSALAVGLRLCAGAPAPAEILPEGTAAIDPASVPLQSPTEAKQSVIAIGDNVVKIDRLAAYRISGIVASIHRYRSDKRADIAPYDVALVFGELARNGLWRRIGWSQHDRWYWWDFAPGDVPGGIRTIVENSSNNHIVPANDTVKRALGALGTGDVVEMTGYLVSLELPGLGLKWRSSLSRDDERQDSCEIVYLEKLRVGNLMWR